MAGNTLYKDNNELLFFILVFLLLFYDPSCIGILSGKPLDGIRPGDDSILFFILVFLLLFYKK